MDQNQAERLIEAVKDITNKLEQLNNQLKKIEDELAIIRRNR